MITKDQAMELLNRLIRATAEDDLPWQQSRRQTNTYYVSLGDGVVSIAATKQFFQLALFNQSGATLGTFRFRGEHLDEGSERVKELYLAARSAALGAGEIYRSMLQALDTGSGDAKTQPREVEGGEIAGHLEAGSPEEDEDSPRRGFVVHDHGTVPAEFDESSETSDDEGEPEKMPFEDHEESYTIDEPGDPRAAHESE